MMQDHVFEIENALRRVLASRQAETPEARRAVYDAAREVLLRSPTQSGGGDDAARLAELESDLEKAIFAIEANADGHSDLRPAVQGAERPAMPAPDRTPSWNVMRLAAGAAFMLLAGGSAYAVSQFGTGDAPANSVVQSLEERDLGEAKESLKQDSKIMGYAGRIERTDDRLFLIGWAVDSTDPTHPVSVVAYAGDKPIAAAAVQGARLDVQEAFKLEEGTPLAFQLDLGSRCPEGEALTVLAVSSDSRYAPLEFANIEARCP